MEKGIKDYLLIWWRQPFEFDWTARHLTALLMLLWGFADGGQVVGRAFVSVTGFAG